MIRLLTITSMKSSARSADLKLASVGFSGKNRGVNLSTSFGGLNAVLTIQYAGKAMMTAKMSPTPLAIHVPTRRLRLAGRDCLGRTIGARADHGDIDVNHQSASPILNICRT